jgi:putative transposase
MGNRIEPGSVIGWQDQEWILMDIPTLDSAVLRHPINGHIEIAKSQDLKSTRSGATGQKGLLAIPPDAWEQAWSRFSALRPLLNRKSRERTAAEVDQVAAQLNKNRATIYRWIERCEATGTVSSLVRKGRNDAGKTRLDTATEVIITHYIDKYFLTLERPTVVDVHEDIEVECRQKKLKPPNLSTIRRRIDSLQDRHVMAKRMGPKKARETFDPIRGSFPGADVPLAVEQVDHTPIDVIFVDEVYRKPIGRGFLTTVVDCCTRMLAGFCVTFDHPGALSTGLALSHAILPKGQWLLERGIEATWPIYGLPAKIFADNAKEFRGTMIERASHEHNFLMENRPKGQPNFGGYIERAFRTFMKKAQRIPGTTFSNTQEKAEYDSEGRAVMTLKEFERWFTIFVLKVYHQRRHRGIGYVPPVKLYEHFILGDEHRKGIGLPEPIHDEFKLKMDFMPYVERTIQEYGVLIDYIYYYADVLRTWIHARDPANSKLKRKFVFVRDPRDISTIYFLDPDAGNYFPVPYRNITHPPMSQWDLNAIIKRLTEHPELQPNEDLIFEGLAELRQIEKDSAEKTKSARRQQQRRNDWGKNAMSRSHTAPPPPPVDVERWDDVVQPYEDIEEST